MIIIKISEMGFNFQTTGEKKKKWNEKCFPKEKTKKEKKYI